MHKGVPPKKHKKRVVLLSLYCIGAYGLGLLLLLLVKLVYTVTATFDCPLSDIIDHRVLEGKL